MLSPRLLGIYLNPDEIEGEMKASGWLDLRQYGVVSSEEKLKEFFRSSPSLREQGLSTQADSLRKTGDRIYFERAAINSYMASALVDFLRQRLIEDRVSFTFETVMSHPGKVAFFKEAQQMGYRRSRDQCFPSAKSRGRWRSRCASG